MRRTTLTLSLLLLALVLAAPVGAQEVFYTETFDSDLGGMFPANDGATSNAWAWDATCPASPLAGHSNPGDARWGNPASCLDYGTEGSSDRLSTGRIPVPAECTDGVRVTYNYFLEFDEDACYDRARVEVELNAQGYVVYADNGSCGGGKMNPARTEAPEGNGGNVGYGNLLNDAAWRGGGFIVASAQPGDLIEVVLIGETDDGIANAGQGFFVDDLVLACQTSPYEIPAVGPAGLAALATLLALAAAVTMYRRRATR